MIRKNSHALQMEKFTHTKKPKTKPTEAKPSEEKCNEEDDVEKEWNEEGTRCT